MANRTLTASVIAAEALAVLDNELGWMNDTIHRALEDEWTEKVNGYKIGSSLDIRRPADFTVRTGSVMDLQEVIEGKVRLTIDTQKGVDFGFTSQELSLEMTGEGGLSERIIRPAMISLVNNIAADVAGDMYKNFYNWAGTPGQTIDSATDFSKAMLRLNQMGVPNERRASLLSPVDHAGLLGAATALFINDANKSAYRDAELGRLLGIETWMSQVTPTHTRGTADNTTPLVKGASQNVTYSTAKDTWTQTIDTDGWDNSCTLKEGDVFTIANVYMVNPRTKLTTGVLQNFVIRSDTTAHASGGTTTLTIAPPIITSGPHQTVNSVPADDAAITLFGTASTAYDQNMAYHKTAMALAFVPMEMPAGAVNPARKEHKRLSVRVIPVYDGTNDVSKWRLDVLYGKKCIDPRKGTRVSGT